VWSLLLFIQSQSISVLSVILCMANCCLFNLRASLCRQSFSAWLIVVYSISEHLCVVSHSLYSISEHLCVVSHSLHGQLLFIQSLSISVSSVILCMANCCLFNLNCMVTVVACAQLCRHVSKLQLQASLCDC